MIRLPTLRGATVCWELRRQHYRGTTPVASGIEPALVDSAALLSSLKATRTLLVLDGVVYRESKP